MQSSISQIIVSSLFVILCMSESNSNYASVLEMPENLEKHYELVSVRGWCSKKWT